VPVRFRLGRATVVVLGPVVRLLLVRARGVGVVPAIGGVVGIGAAVRVLEAVLLLGLVRTLVVLVGDGVAVVVAIGAAVRVLEAVQVLRLRRTLILVVVDAVAVAIARLRGVGDAEDRTERGHAYALHDARAERREDAD